MGKMPGLVVFIAVFLQLNLNKTFAHSTSVQEKGGVSSIWVILAMIAAAIVFMLFDKARKKK